MTNRETQDIVLELEKAHKRCFRFFELAPVGYLRLDGRGLITEANLRAAGLLGEKKKFLIGKVLGSFVGPIFQDAYRSFVEEMPQKHASSCEVLLVRKDLSVFCARLEVLPFPDDETPFEWTWIAMLDISQIAEAREQLRESKERWRQIIENAPFGYYRVGKDSTFEYVNPEWERMFGYPQPEVLGKTFMEVQPEAEQDEARKRLEAVLGGAIVRGEFARARKNGRLEYHTSFIKPIWQGDGIVGGEGFLVDITKQKEARERAQALSHALLRAQEKERERIALELHDSVAQELAAVKIGCQCLCEESVDGIFELRQRVSSLSAMLQKALDNLRIISYDLRPPGLDMGLVPALEELCADFEQKMGVHVEFTTVGLENLKLGSEREINLYRLVQEALNNVEKHAFAKQITVKLAAAGSCLILRLMDDGRGFDPQQAYQPGNPRRMGLRGMRERVRLLHGEMGIQSEPGKGTNISIKLPL